jgi:hypothetical protein
MGLADALSGAISGAGTGLMLSGGNPFGALVGASIGAGAGILLAQNAPKKEFSKEQEYEFNHLRDIESGKIESPEVQALRSQSNKNFSQISGAMNMNRGASQGAKSAYLASLGAEKQAQTNETAIAANANAVLNARRQIASMLAEQSDINYQNKVAESQRRGTLINNATNLLTTAGMMSYDEKKDITNDGGLDAVRSVNRGNRYLKFFNALGNQQQQNSRLGEQQDVGY